MADTATASAVVEKVETKSSPAKGRKAKAAAAGGAKKPKSKPTHPPTSQMVSAAIKELKDKKGSSLAAIKKYIAANYKLDVDKLNFYIKKALRDGVEGGTLVRTKGVGASGSFKLPASGKNEKTGTDKPKVAKKSASKSAKPKAKSAKPKATAAKKSTGEKKAAKATAKAAKATGAVKAKTPKQKTTKPSKAAPKTKVPKAKKLAAPKKAAAAAKKS